MRRSAVVSALAFAILAHAAQAQPVMTDGPYKVLKTAKVGGEGGTDYIYADVVGRRLYIPRGAVRAAPATDATPERVAVPARITVFNLDNLEPIGEILTAPNSQGNGAAVDPKSGHGFTSSRPAITMFDTKSLQLIKSIPIDSGVGRTAFSLIRSTTASTCSAIQRRMRRSSIQRTARYSAGSNWAVCQNKAWPTAKASSTWSCRTRKGVSPSWTSRR